MPAGRPQGPGKKFHVNSRGLEKALLDTKNRSPLKTKSTLSALNASIAVQDIQKNKFQAAYTAEDKALQLQKNIKNSAKLPKKEREHSAQSIDHMKTTKQKIRSIEKFKKPLQHSVEKLVGHADENYVRHKLKNNPDFKLKKRKMRNMSGGSKGSNSGFSDAYIAGGAKSDNAESPLIEGGKHRRYKFSGGKWVPVPVTLEGGKRHRRRMSGGADIMADKINGLNLEGGKRRRHRMRGGSALKGGQSPAAQALAGGELEGGRRRRHRMRGGSALKGGQSPAPAAAEPQTLAGGELEGGKRRRHRMRGGSALKGGQSPAPAAPVADASSQGLDGGKSNPWIKMVKHMAETKGWSYKKAMSSPETKRRFRKMMK